MEQADEDGDLHEHRQASGEGVEAVLALQLLHLLGHLDLILAVLLTDGLHLRLDLLHLLRRLDLFDEGLVEDRPQREHEEHHRRAHAMPLPLGVSGVILSNNQCQSHMIPDTG